MTQDSSTMFRRMREQFQLKFDRGIQTEWNIFAMCHVTLPEDGGDFTPEQVAWIGGYEAGYSDGGFS